MYYVEHGRPFLIHIFYLTRSMNRLVHPTSRERVASAMSRIRWISEPRT